MSAHVYPKASTAVLFIDPLNDFISEDGLLWPHMKANAERVGLLPNLRKLLAGARHHGLKLAFVPHHRHDEGDFEGWHCMNPTHRQIAVAKPFPRTGWGGEFHPEIRPQTGDIVCAEHWMQSGFANTDLDYLLRMHGIDHLVLSGMRTNACFESTARYGVELGYHVTLLSDATAAFRREDMDATLLVNAPYFAHAIMTTDEFLAGLG